MRFPPIAFTAVRNLLVTLIIFLTSVQIASAGTEMARVVRVVDGSNVVVTLAQKETKVRLLGLVTPAGLDALQQKQAQLCRAFLTQLLNGGWVYLELDRAVPSPDKQGRLVAYMYRQDGAFVNERMISEGYAARDSKLKFFYEDQFSEAQIKASNSQRGLWSNSDSRASNWGSQAVSGQPIALDDSVNAPKFGDARKVKSKTKTRISIAN
ncbi:MAG TPA: thermonuclease family protein [Thermoanaerobaculia bacterium]|nr:thermonuclease family protein [Thermoanaerobaculia bacterium]